MTSRHRRRTGYRGSVPHSLAVALLALILGACGSSAGPPSTPSPTAPPTPTSSPRASTEAQGVDALLQEAIAATIDAGTVSLDMSMTFIGSSVIPDGIFATVDGMFAFGARRQVSASMDLSAIGQGVIEMVIDEPDTWIRFRGSDRELVPDDKWAHVGPESTGGFASAFRNVLAGPNDTTLMVYYLFGSVGDGEVVGTESVAGTRTTHVRTTLDLDLALDRVPAEARDALLINISEIRDQGIDPTIGADAWIADDGLILRQRLKYTLTALQGGGIMVADILFTGHGEPLDLPIPAAADTIEADEIELPRPS
jgi:hypothetical protein